MPLRFHSFNTHLCTSYNRYNVSLLLEFYCARNVQFVARLQVLEKENAELKARLERLEERTPSQHSPRV